MDWILACQLFISSVDSRNLLMTLACASCETIGYCPFPRGQFCVCMFTFSGIPQSIVTTGSMCVTYCIYALSTFYVQCHMNFSPSILDTGC
ncbi:hypothetical protein TSUD_14750 [Trifolium subterraneum]|uniref:Uncharacterized protein n=1 Tax=Trifolium subterraneum TaxID=3900 RepID=A0A2Z6MUQ1_TRISU|nr:hypothetical protein TSUD_14750 [Trifolium subterraneum]